MRIVFWQNCLSPHQLPYIVHLIDDVRVSEVMIVVEEAMGDARKAMGWSSSFSELDNCKIVIAPQRKLMEEILSANQADSYHLFSGIRGFRFVFDALKLSLKYAVKRGIITERPYTFAFGRANGKPLWLHRIRFMLQDRKYAKYIQSVFAMGDDAVDYYRSVWKQWNVYSFAYCTKEKESVTGQLSGIPKFAFVGNLSVRKAPISILKANAQNGCLGEVDLIGDGSERPVLDNYISAHNVTNVRLLGTKMNTEIPCLLENKDVLILPSIYDGWGAVVNEALTQGLFVICSDKCGAKELLNDCRCGLVFNSNDYTQLASAMRYCAEHIEKIRNNRAFRKAWAQQSISGKAISRYMIDCLCGVEVERPWMKIAKC